ncbi:hypothetical protein [Streptomyces sp. NPDC048282]|uniref:hypothetical protein n=1 Tax=Streptomyces sp. NPDC048282 TaxID=3365528 RepID=UPI003721961B
MPSFQTGSIPHGFTADETGVVFHPKNAIVVLPPPPNGPTFGWRRVYFSLGSDFGDVKIRVGIFRSGAWTHQFLDVSSGGNRVGFTLENSTQKLSLGRVKRSASDRDDDIPVSWMLESEA